MVRQNECPLHQLSQQRWQAPERRSVITVACRRVDTTEVVPTQRQLRRRELKHEVAELVVRALQAADRILKRREKETRERGTSPGEETTGQPGASNCHHVVTFAHPLAVGATRDDALFERRQADAVHVHFEHVQ